ncbi:MAG TPA: gamma-glutamyltransferase family protein [Rhodospirillales bacterium]|nr:gamma-glutamyltransferase family protein [Rhodospirillales bacterium]
MFTTRPELSGTFGAVASTHWLASASGMAMLEAGGNAFDAVVAAGLVLQVAEPHLNGPGGDLPMIYHRADRAETKVVCAQGTAPAGATIAHYRDLGLDLVPASGLLATVVPGAFDGWMVMLRDHGTMRLEDVFERAIHYAETGIPVVERMHETIAVVRDLFMDEWTTSADLYLRGGAVPAIGSYHVNKTLAATWRRLLAEAKAGGGGGREGEIEAVRRAWYEGFVAEEIDRYCRDTEIMDTSGRRHRGVLSGADMAAWRATYENPVRYDYGDYTVCKGGPWSQGPVFLQQLALLAGFDLAAMDPLGPEFVHTVVECAKLAFADREAFYGDPDFVDVPMEFLLSDDYNAARRKLIGAEASMEVRPGTIEGYGGAVDDEAADRVALKGAPGAIGYGEPTVSGDGAARGDTCHVDVIDKDGNMVSATPSGGWLQSSPVIPELGFCLNSRGQMFWLKEGLPASLEPGKRPRSTLSVNLCMCGDEPYMVFGTPGGDQQDQWSLSFFLRHVHHGMNLQESIDAPQWQNMHFLSSFWPRSIDTGVLNLEDRFAAATIDDLKRRGHRASQADGWSFGRISAVSRVGGIIRAAANPRHMQGYAVGR